MTEKLTKEVFYHIVELAALELGEEEAAYLFGELNNQLGAIQDLEAIPIPEETKPAAHGVPYNKEISASLREDKNLPYENSEAILNGAPEITDNYFEVPEIPHEDLD